MGGQGSQRNKVHKSGSRAGRSARQKHRDKRDVVERRPIKATGRGAQGKAERLNAAKQQRDKMRTELLLQRRQAAPPRVVALLPLSADVDVGGLWAGLLRACLEPQRTQQQNGSTAMDVEAGMASAAAGEQPPLAMTTVAVAGRRRLAFTFLPPPEARDDPLAVVELGKAADVVLLAMPGDEAAIAVDEQGDMALAVLRALGLPSVVGLVALEEGADGKAASLKARSAAKKAASAALAELLPGEYRMCLAGGATDMTAVVRHLVDTTPATPHWRQHRPALLVEGAEFCAGGGDNAAVGTLQLRGYVRTLGLSVNQAVHIPMAGDFQLARLEALEPPAPSGATDKAAQGGEEDGMADAPGAGRVLAACMPNPTAQESLQRENAPDPLAGEQTWPTQEELMEAEAAQHEGGRARKRRLPPGTSDYQAAWILDDDEEGGSNDDDLSEGGSPCMSDVSPAGLDGEEAAAVGGMDLGDTGTEFGMEADDEEDPTRLADMLEELKARRRAEEEDAQFPDEVDCPPDVPARQRFAKYRGLKSFRTSAWDPKESLPLDYARVFALERPRRTEKRAKEMARQAGTANDPFSVPAGSYVQLAVANVPTDVAAHVCARVEACSSAAVPPLVVFGLLQHECKLSVLNFGVRKCSGVEEPVAAKERLLLVTGLRSFPARPIYSTDEHGVDKHKMERFLHEGRPSVATMYAPISYGPLPLLAFREAAAGNGPPCLVATGSLRGCDPDRVVLKKIVLAGYPVKVHKHKAVCRFMFHNPDDVRWFRPLELWTKGGRRGRISEPVGTHGAMKCVFDGPLKHQEAVHVSLYKRVFPKWPESLSFC